MSEAIDKKKVDSFGNPYPYTKEFLREEAKKYPEVDVDAAKKYKEFSEKFGYDKLEALSEDKLLNYIFPGTGDESLCEVLKKKSGGLCSDFGGIGGQARPNSYGLYKDKNGKWNSIKRFSGESGELKDQSDDGQALDIGKRIRDDLVNGAKCIESWPQLKTEDDYVKLYKKLMRNSDEDEYGTDGMIYNIWFRKYYHMLFPEHFSTFYDDGFLNGVLKCVGLPTDGDKFTKSGRIACFIKECGISTRMMGHLYYKLVTEPERMNKNKDGKGGYKMDKERAIALVRKNRPDLVDKVGENNIIYAGCDGIKKDNYWLNPVSSVLSRDWAFILDDQIRKQIHIFFVGAGEISSNSLKDRNDETNGGKLEIKIKYDNSDFVDIRKGYRFKKHLVDTISYDDDEENLAHTRSHGDNKRHLNTILYGAPGTGKTYSTRRKALDLLGESYDPNDEDDIKKRYNELRKKQRVKLDSDNQIESIEPDDQVDNEEPDDQKVEIWEPRIQFVTFHQSYGYEEFIEGIRAETKDGVVTYDTKPGVFKKFCDTAKKDKGHRYVFIIDEINRGNISKIFGELITLIEDNKREDGDDPVSAVLPYSGETFFVPSNVYILGTMNTADRSITSIDIALRRRFYFEEMPPKSDQLAGITVGDIDIKKMFERMNERIEVLYDREHCIGHAYFLGLKKDSSKDSSIENLAEIFKMSIIPLLQEYFYNDYRKIRCILRDDIYGDNASSDDKKKQFITAEKVGNDLVGNLSSGNDYIYKINEKALNNPEAYKKIYS